MSSYPALLTKIGAAPLTRPEDVFATKPTKSGKTGHLSVSIPIDRLQEATDAMTALKKLNMFRSNAALALDSLIMAAKLVQEDERFAELFQDIGRDDE